MMSYLVMQQDPNQLCLALPFPSPQIVDVGVDQDDVAPSTLQLLPGCTCLHLQGLGLCGVQRGPFAFRFVFEG